MLNEGIGNLLDGAEHEHGKRLSRHTHADAATERLYANHDDALAPTNNAG